MDNVLKTIIAEAAGEGEEGMYAVASVIANRAKRRRLTPEQVVDQPAQFTGRWRKDLDAFIAKQPPAVLQAAQRALERAQKEPLGGADHYLTNDLYNSAKRPSWAGKMDVTQTVGRHTFLDSTRRKQTMPKQSSGQTQRSKPQANAGPIPLEEKLFRMEQSVRGFERGMGMPEQGLSVEELKQIATNAQRGMQTPGQAPGQGQVRQGVPMRPQLGMA